MLTDFFIFISWRRGPPGKKVQKLHCRVGHNMPIASDRKCKTQKILDAHCKYQDHLSELEVSLCTRFQLDCFYSFMDLCSQKWFLTFLHCDPKIQDDHPKIDTHIATLWTSVCTKFQVDSSKTFWVMLRKLNLTFVISVSVTLKIEVMIPKWTGIHKGL